MIKVIVTILLLVGFGYLTVFYPYRQEKKSRKRRQDQQKSGDEKTILNKTNG